VQFLSIQSVSISLPVFSYPVNFHFSLKSLLSVLLLDELTSVTTKEKVHNEQTLDLQYIRLGVKNPSESIFSNRFLCCMGCHFIYFDV
jgi:hypothetical protein